jgi:hypothetical protein
MLTSKTKIADFVGWFGRERRRGRKGQVLKFR